VIVPPGFDVDSEPFSAGKHVLVANKCFVCHAINGIGGPPPRGGGGGFGRRPRRGGQGQVAVAGQPAPGGGAAGNQPQGGPRGQGRRGGPRAPDLGTVGSDPTHDVDWLMVYVRNPRTVNPDSRMPGYNDKKINDDDLRALAEYLNSLK
jgi:hypothetical protein